MEPIRITTITQYHRLACLAKPDHPLISVVRLETLKRPEIVGPFSMIFDFYSISLKKNFNLKMRYGQQPHDFDEGMLHCMAPGQILTVEIDKDEVYEPSGWMIFIHPDFLYNTPLAKAIKRFEYFNYSVTEALYLSDKEENVVSGIVQIMEQEYHSNIDKFSQSVIIAQLELLLTYTDRFYQRQFITRKIASHDILTRLEELLNHYFTSGALAKQGLPSVTYISQSLNISPSYLTALLKNITGQSTQQLLHDKLIELAKEKLSTTNLSVSEIAYLLGFEHLSSFSKLFKSKTTYSPLAFRQHFN
ncbi:MAG: helix-turn-helix transcriptional regulator [Bacteroidota bacterium]